MVGQASQKLQAINPQTYLGPGKLAELVQLAKSAGAETIIFVCPSRLPDMLWLWLLALIMPPSTAFPGYVRYQTQPFASLAWSAHEVASI